MRNNLIVCNFPNLTTYLEGVPHVRDHILFIMLSTDIIKFIHQTAFDDQQSNVMLPWSSNHVESESLEWQGRELPKYSAFLCIEYMLVRNELDIIYDAQLPSR